MASPNPVTVSNVKPRRDARGEILDCHDGALHQFGDRYYLYGTAYGDTDGFTPANRFRCYSSADLATWALEGDLLKDARPGVHYRPHVAFNPKTQKYVLWYNWYPKLWDGQYGVAVSDAPAGPFALVEPAARVRHDKHGDHNLFVDDDGAGYIIYTSISEGHAISVERLTDDFLGSTLQGSDDLARGCEGAALFRRGNLYYALFDTCCCFCPEGSGAQVHIAEQPLGKYRFVGNINRAGGDAKGKPTIAAQQTHVAQLSTGHTTQFVWIADRWGSRPDRIKGHDFQYWSAPLLFRDDGTIEPLRWVDEWSFGGA